MGPSSKVLRRLDDVPPFHANCDCTIIFAENEVVKDNIVDSVQDKQKKKRNMVEPEIGLHILKQIKSKEVLGE